MDEIRAFESLLDLVGFNSNDLFLAANSGFCFGSAAAVLLYWMSDDKQTKNTNRPTWNWTTLGTVVSILIWRGGEDGGNEQ